MAGINAALAARRGLEELVLSRADGYIGVLIDDLLQVLLLVLLLVLVLVLVLLVVLVLVLIVWVVFE